MTLKEYEEQLLKSCAYTNPENNREIRMRCLSCGKRFWVQVGLVAYNEKYHKITECSACKGKMTIIKKWE